MTHITIERAKLEQWLKAVDMFAGEDRQKALHEAGKEMLQALAAPVQEPCGWQFYQDGKWHNGMETNNHRANTEAAGFRVRDVCASPPAAPVPLTLAKILAMWGSENGLEDCDLCKFDDFVQVVRFIESASGITEKDQP
jgi:hypothetical protein